MRTTMDSLPTESVRHIAEFIHLEHPRSLYDFSLVNRRCHAAASTWKLRNIRFDVTSRTKLRQDVERCVEILRQSQSLQHVRGLEINGMMPRRLQDELSDQEQDWTLNDDTWYGTDEVFGDSEDAVFVADGPVAILPEEDEAWAPVVELLHLLPRLKHFVFNCTNQFPPCLLAALHEHQSQCALHLGKFRFRSLGQDTPDAHEMAVATSSSLQSIGVRWVFRDSNGLDDYNEEAVVSLIGGLAPNLKTLRMVHCRAASSAALHRARGTPRKPWSGFGKGFWTNRLPKGSETVPASLESLTLSRYGPITSDYLVKWQKHTPFAALRYLDLQAGVNGEALRWAAVNASFPQLSELRIKIDRDDETEPKPDFASDCVAFFSSLLPLDKLLLSGSIDPEVFDCIVGRHGKTLRQLSLSPHESSYSTTRCDRPTVFTRDDVIQLQASCPVLEELAMPIKRYKGGKPEVEIYRALGKMKWLTTLFLNLDCSNTSVLLDGDETPNDPSFDSYMQEFWGSGLQRRPRNGHVRDALVNSAVDERLARAIWDTISTARVGRPLKSLKLWAHSGASFGDSSYQTDLMNMIQHLSRAYLVERSVRDDDDSISVQELGKRAREARDEMERQRERDIERRWGDKRTDERPGLALQIFRRIWPARNGSQDWRADWESLPLQI
ncbi:hypothetical protein JX266_012661 [Neoarthrinium moseri]|nr:hypothetical protein JX266_012661 [Neoarthrinium moseri]